MKLSRRTTRFGALPDLYFFNCVACDEWQFEEGDPATAESPSVQAVRGRAKAVVKPA
jgi:hypothetical protein